MQERVRALANFIRDKHSAGDRFVLMLGAGASLSSGVKTTKTIMSELVAKYGTSRGGSLDDQFDRLWTNATADERLLMLEPYLKQRASSGYAQMAELIRLGYFDVVLTFNYDNLVEQSLQTIGFHDYKVIIRGEVDLDAIGTLVRAKQPRVKILKLHGSLRSADCFLFSKEEMLNYPDPLKEIVRELTGRSIIICGYAFNDECVRRAFNESKDASSIYFVNPDGAVDNVKGFLIARRSLDKVISGDLGRFDEFFEALHEDVLRPAETVPAQPQQNPFKFMDHYVEQEEPWFVGRRQLALVVKKRITKAGGAMLVLYGKPKVGKTSFVRAGLIPRLGDHECLYVRCRHDFEQQLWTVLQRRYRLGDTPDWPAAIASMKAPGERPVVIILDQFERACRPAESSRERRDQLLNVLSILGEAVDDRLSVVCVPVEEIGFWKILAQVPVAAGRERELEEIKPFMPTGVARVLRYAARRGGVTLDPAIIDTLCAKYRDALGQSSEARALTLMHMQTICYYLARKKSQPWWDTSSDAGFLPDGLSAVAESIKDESSLIDLLDDLPSDERRLIRSFLKAICDPYGNTRKLIEFIRTHFPEIKEDRFPEPIA